MTVTFFPSSPHDAQRGSIPNNHFLCQSKGPFQQTSKSTTLLGIVQCRLKKTKHQGPKLERKLIMQKQIMRKITTILAKRAPLNNMNLFITTITRCKILPLVAVHAKKATLGRTLISRHSSMQKDLGCLEKEHIDFT